MGQEVPSRFEQLWWIEQTAEYLALSTKTLYGWRCRKYATHIRIRQLMGDRFQPAGPADSAAAEVPREGASSGQVNARPCTHPAGVRSFADCRCSDGARDGGGLGQSRVRWVAAKSAARVRHEDEFALGRRVRQQLVSTPGLGQR